MVQNLSLAVIGCGAIAESYYFPVLKADPAWRRAVWLVEPSAERRDKLAAANGFETSQCVSGIEDLPGTVTAAINATPSHVHVVTTAPLLDRGVSVIVEKPLAEFADEARGLIATAERRNCKLTVNQLRRFGPSYRLVKDYIEAGKLGTVTSIVWQEGHRFDWPTQSGFNFRRPWPNGRPRGALLDIGVHVFDMICWWLGEELTFRSATLDGYGGPEAVVTAALASPTATIDVTISFLEKLQNSYEIHGTHGTIRGRTADLDSIAFKPAGGHWRRIAAPGSTSRIEHARAFIANFLAAVEGREKLTIEAASVVPALAAIDAIYENASEDMPRYYREWVA
jgi:predicted dehydrogenase